MDWYIAELAPGATREMSGKVPWVRTSKPVLWARPPRPNETAVEYALSDAGFTPYLPRMRKETIHHRTRKTIVRSFPLFTGYAFIGTDPLRPRFRDMLDAKGVLRLLGADGRYTVLTDEQVGIFRTAEEDMVFDDTKEARIWRRQEGRTQLETIRMQFPIGTQVHISAGPFAGFGGHVDSVVGRGLVKTLVNLFGRLTPIDTPVEALHRVA